MIFSAFNNITDEQYNTGFQYFVKNVKDIESIGFAAVPLLNRASFIILCENYHKTLHSLILCDDCSLKTYQYIEYLLTKKIRRFITTPVLNITHFQCSCYTNVELLSLLCGVKVTHISHLTFHWHKEVNTSTMIRILTCNPQIISVSCPLCWGVDKQAVVDFIANSGRDIHFE